MEWGSDFGNLDDVSNKHFLGSVSSDKNFETVCLFWVLLQTPTNIDLLPQTKR